jgi:hypothetical protein
MAGGGWRHGAVGGGGLVDESCLRNSGHYFDSGLVGEKEIEEGNAPTGLRRSASGRGRRATARRGGGAPASNRALEGGEQRGKRKKEEGGERAAGA